MSNDELLSQLKDIVLDLDHAIKEVHNQHGEDAYRMRYRDGTYILLHALAAKATALSAIASLEARIEQ